MAVTVVIEGGTAPYRLVLHAYDGTISNSDEWSIGPTLLLPKELLVSTNGQQANNLLQVIDAGAGIDQQISDAIFTIAVN